MIVRYANFPPATYKKTVCDNCDKDFQPEDIVWLWVGVPRDGSIVMHKDCFIDWMPRIEADLRALQLIQAQHQVANLEFRIDMP